MSYFEQGLTTREILTLIVKFDVTAFVKLFSCCRFEHNLSKFLLQSRFSVTLFYDFGNNNFPVPETGTRDGSEYSFCC